MWDTYLSLYRTLKGFSFEAPTSPELRLAPPSPSSAINGLPLPSNNSPAQPVVSTPLSLHLVGLGAQFKDSSSTILQDSATPSSQLSHASGTPVSADASADTSEISSISATASTSSALKDHNVGSVIEISSDDDEPPIKSDWCVCESFSVLKRALKYMTGSWSTHLPP